MDNILESTYVFRDILVWYSIWAQEALSSAIRPAPITAKPMPINSPPAPSRGAVNRLKDSLKVPQ